MDYLECSSVIATQNSLVASVIHLFGDALDRDSTCLHVDTLTERVKNTHSQLVRCFVVTTD
jgi:hypothetical protein